MAEHAALDKYLNVTISEDKTMAYLQFSSLDDNKFTPEELEKFIRNHKIQYGIEYHMIDRIANHPGEYQYTKTPIAIGVPPIHGTDGSIEFSFKIEEAKTRRPVENENGDVDYKEIISLNNVRKGQLIAQRKLAEPGKNGISVQNEEIAFKPGKEVYFKSGKNVLINAEQTAMYAAIDGMITTTDKNKINVFPIYEINGDVDYSTGNIDFVGTVVIRGNVLSGFRIKAAGDIRVIGGVEGAELEAEGSIEITSGIIGYHKGYVKAGHNVKSSFIQDGNVIAGEDVLVSQSIMHSNIRAGKNVICKGTKGLIVGGTIQAGEKAVARTIGNTMSTVTIIEVGVLPELRNELVDLRNQLKVLTDNMEKTGKGLNMLDQLAATGQLTTDKLSMRIKLKATQSSYLRENAEIKERILEIEKMLEDTGRARVDIEKTIYGGSKIVIGRYTRYVKDTSERVSFYYSEGDISMVPFI
ncbi:uncharacterized protein (DUF342 family) [Paenibacillus sp. DS2015]|uniref:DUF342 domain-containing protein n=1 Tax=Paenibacillus sp. DS2015 TaxID=3373917 RepID=UPI003D25C467